jgi:hypothetical protein
VKDLIAENFYKLKHYFIYLSSKSSYPALGSFDCSNFAAKCEIPDSRVPSSTIDRTFIAAVRTDRGCPEVPNNPGNALCRYQFLEIIVRLAGEKFK